jgi:hypothetical protein
LPQVNEKPYSNVEAKQKLNERYDDSDKKPTEKVLNTLSALSDLKFTQNEVHKTMKIFDSDQSLS